MIQSVNDTQVVRCSLEHAASVAKTFLTSDAVVVDIKEVEQPVQMPMPMRKPLRKPGNVTFSLASPNCLHKYHHFLL